jgi:biopolymer transport protein ExbB
VGLLGTVSGMVETFNALAGDAQAGMSMAGGISRALITTQYGLLIAIPGTLASRALDRKAMRIRDLWRTRAQEPLVVSR